MPRSIATNGFGASLGFAGWPRHCTKGSSNTASIALAPEVVPGRKRMARVGARGESVAALARRYKVAPAQLARWNGVSAQASFKAGQQVVVGIVAPKPAARGRAATVARAPASHPRKTGKAAPRAVAKAAPPRKAVKVARH